MMEKEMPTIKGGSVFVRLVIPSTLHRHGRNFEILRISPAPERHRFTNQRCPPNIVHPFCLKALRNNSGL
jgi:hypothetical protein